MTVLLTVDQYELTLFPSTFTGIQCSFCVTDFPNWNVLLQSLISLPGHHTRKHHSLQLQLVNVLIQCLAIVTVQCISHHILESV